MRLKRRNPQKKSLSLAGMSTRKLSLFNRWKNAAVDVELDGITEEERLEYKEAFRLFDKVCLAHETNQRP